MSSEWTSYNSFYDVLRQYDDDGALLKATIMRAKGTDTRFDYSEMLDQVNTYEETHSTIVGKDAWREFDNWFVGVYLVQRDSPADPFTTDDGFIDGM